MSADQAASITITLSGAAIASAAAFIAVMEFRVRKVESCIRRMEAEKDRRADKLADSLKQLLENDIDFGERLSRIEGMLDHKHNGGERKR